MNDAHTPKSHSPPSVYMLQDRIGEDRRDYNIDTEDIYIFSKDHGTNIQQQRRVYCVN